MAEATTQEKTKALQVILDRLEKMGQFSAKFLMYASAVGMITILGGINLPPELRLLFEGIGVNIISSLIERIAQGEYISDDALKEEIKGGINTDKIETLLTTNDFFRAVAKLRRNQDIALSKQQTAEFNIGKKLDDVLYFLRETRYLSEKKEYPFPPYIAHPYTLSDHHGFFGRQKELQKLTKWVGAKHHSPVLFITGFGGTGKSALAWNWFNVSSQSTSQWAGMLWWSFYKTDTSFGDFIAHSLAYVSGQSLNEIRSLPRTSQEQDLIHYLNQNRFLFVIDGLERLTFAYAKSIFPQEKIRARRKHLAQMIDERDGRFLLYLTKVEQSRVLITSRVYPFDLCDPLTLRKIPNTFFSPGKMKDGDALALWKSMGITGSEVKATRLFRALHNNPLLIKVLAASIMKYRPAPRDFEKWVSEHKYFNPYQYTNLRETIIHVFQNTITGISIQQAKILEIASGLRTPIRYELLLDLFVGKKAPPYTEYRVFEMEEIFDDALVDLEERGLLAWDAVNNVYDIHPLVRDFVWFSLSRDTQEQITSTLVYSYALMNMLDSLVVAIESHDSSVTMELFYLLARLGEYTEAWRLFRDHFFVLLQNHGIHQLRTMLNILANAAMKGKEPFNTLINFGFLVSAFTTIYLLKGDILSAKRVAKSALAIFLHDEYFEGIIRSQLQLAMLLAFSGDLKQSEALAVDALKSSRLHFDKVLEGWSQVAIGILRLFEEDQQNSTDLIVSGTRWIALNSKNPMERENALFIRAIFSAQDKSTLPMEYSQKGKLYTLWLSMMQGQFAIISDQLEDAEFIISDALSSATKMGLTLYEFMVLSMQTELALMQGNRNLSRRLIIKALSYPNISELKLIYLNLLITLAEIERDEKDSNAVNTATKIYEIAFYEKDRPVFMSLLENATNIIHEFGGIIPEMPIKDLSSEKISIDPELKSLLKII